MKLYHQQREEARARSQILKARSTARRKLDEEERHLHKKVNNIKTMDLFFCFMEPKKRKEKLTNILIHIHRKNKLNIVCVDILQHG